MAWMVGIGQGVRCRNEKTTPELGPSRQIPGLSHSCEHFRWRYESSKGKDPNLARFPQISLSKQMPANSPATRLDIDASCGYGEGLLKVTAFGPDGTKLASAQRQCPKGRLQKFWQSLMAQQALEIPDAPIEGPKNQPISKVTLKWEGGEHSFSGPELDRHEPYRSILTIIEKLARKVLRDVQMQLNGPE